MDHRACVYHLLDASGSCLYVGLTRSLRVRLNGHKATDWFCAVHQVGAKFFHGRLEAEIFEAMEIVRCNPPRNGTHYNLCKVWNRQVSGRPPNNSRFMSEKEKSPPWYFAKCELVGEYDALFHRDRRSEQAGFDHMRRAPYLQPQASERNVFIATDNNLSDWLKRREPGDVKPPAGLII